MFFSYLQHRSACHRKQQERADRIASLPPPYLEPPSEKDKEILNTSLSALVSNVQTGVWTGSQVLLAYSRQAIRAHEKTNCLTEIMISAADQSVKERKLSGPLAGVPVSLKDLYNVAGWDSSIGYSAWTGQPAQQESSIVRLLRDAGAILYVKTTVPITMLSFESSSDVFGCTSNPHNSKYTSGGSSGGESALIAFGGSRVGLGSDVAGSVRVPSHYSGIYTIKASHQRFPKSGNMTCIPGQEGVAAACSPMARSLQDLETFWKAVFEMKPWTYDPQCLEIPWRKLDLTAQKLRFGIMWDDGVVPLSPACRRALTVTKQCLEDLGYEIVDFLPPDPYEGLKIATHLLFADAGNTPFKPIRFMERNDPGMANASKWFSLPSFMKKIYVWWVRYVKQDEIYAGLLEGLQHEKSTSELWALVARRNAYQGRWFDAWNDAGLDFLLTAPNALPALPHGGMRRGFTACGYTFMFNLLDYSAGVLPVTTVDESLDTLDPLTAKEFSQRNAIARGAYTMYNAADMHGLPVGVQIVGRRHEEEKVLEGMKLVEAALRKGGYVYQQLAL